MSNSTQDSPDHNTEDGEVDLDAEAQQLRAELSQLHQSIGGDAGPLDSGEIAAVMTNIGEIEAVLRSLEQRAARAKQDMRFEGPA